MSKIGLKLMGGGNEKILSEEIEIIMWFRLSKEQDVKKPVTNMFESFSYFIFFKCKI